MNREQILSKSRMENKNKDLYKMQLQIQAGNIGSLAATLLATLFFVMQSVVGGGFNFGLYAIILSVSAAGITYKAIRLRRRRDILLASLYSLGTLALTVIHICTIIRPPVD